MRSVQLFLDVPMGLGHRGLFLEAKKMGVDLRLMRDGECAIFVNPRKDKIKTYSANGVVSYVRLDDPRDSLSLGVLDLIPQSANPNTKMEYSAKVLGALEKLGIMWPKRKQSREAAA